MTTRLWVLTATVVLLVPALGQDSTSLRRDREASWAKKTGLPTSVIHQMWRSPSHFADEQDDDSQIELLDPKSLANRNQILLVTSAGEPRCLTLSVFSNAAGFLKLWSADATPDGRGLCDKLGLSARVAPTDRGIEVIIPVGRHSPTASHADVERWPYRWTGKTYSAGTKSLELEYIPR